MDNGFLMVGLIFCVGPLITFMAGFAAGRWSKTYTIAKRDTINNEVKSSRYAPTSSRGLRRQPTPDNQPTGER